MLVLYELQLRFEWPLSLLFPLLKFDQLLWTPPPWLKDTVKLPREFDELLPW